MRAQEGDDLIGGDSHGDGAADGISCDLAGDHVGVARAQSCEEL